MVSQKWILTFHSLLIHQMNANLCPDIFYLETVYGDWTCTFPSFSVIRQYLENIFK